MRTTLAGCGRMKKYIEQEYVRKCMEDSYKHAGISAEAKAKMTRWLNKAPATAGVLEVVPCRDCINKEASILSNAFICLRWGVRVGPDDYCSRGERHNCDADMKGEVE